MSHQLPKAVQADLAELSPVFAAHGFVPVAHQHSPWSFGGNYFVDFFSPSEGKIRVLFDRSQYTIELVDRSELEPAGLWRAFDDRTEFESAVIAWLRGRRAG